MKIKFKQRLLIGYYTTKFKTIGLVSPQKAAEQAFELFSTPFKPSGKRHEPPIFQKATRVEVKVRELTVRGYEWKNEDPEAPKVLIAHGFSSYAYKFEAYVSTLKKAGYTVLAFDAPAHGNSEGKRINALIYRDTILAIEQKLGTLNAIVAHSLGGLAASLAIEMLPEPHKRKLVLIAPATETTTAIDNYFKMIPVDTIVKQAFEKHIEQLANRPISYFSVARVVKQDLVATLWIHDEEDLICTFRDVKPLLNQSNPKLKFFITKGLGHNLIYKDPGTRAKVAEFLSNRSSGDFL